MSAVDELIMLTNCYFRGVDLADYDLLADCLSPAVIAEHSMIGRIEGLEAFWSVISSLPSEIVTLQHYLTNHEVELDGDHALVRASLFAQHVVRAGTGTELMPGGGRYLFQCERVKGRWRIRQLENRVTWAHPGLAEVFTPPQA